jgi:homocysteine S-methyltransferase
MNGLLEQLHKAPLLGDGAMGTLLFARGIATDHCLEALVVEQPMLVATIHEEYARAGADYLTTHTFGANRLRLATYGLDSHVGEFNRKAVELARNARAATERGLLIAGNVGPVGQRVDWDDDQMGHRVADAFAEQIEALVEAGVDFLLFETFSDVQELAVAVQIAQSLGGASTRLPIVASMSYGEDGLTPAGQSVEEVTARLRTIGVDVIGANCSVGPAHMIAILRRMHETAPHLSFSVTPNAGLPVMEEEGVLRYPVGPHEFAAFMPNYLSMGAVMAGGCCGTTPAHIKAMRAVMDGLHR